jgi:phage baseplate assembly protein W
MSNFYRFYKGFSTRNYENLGTSLEITDISCIEEDLLNEIFTIRGERVMMPTYGTRIPLLLFEMNDASTMDIIKADLTEVFNHDPRVEIVNLDVISSPDRNALMAIAKLNYKEFAVIKDLWITINSR